MTIQVRKDDWNWAQDRKEINNRLEKNRVCDICLQSFTSAKKVKAHKRKEHAY